MSSLDGSAPPPSWNGVWNNDASRIADKSLISVGLMCTDNNDLIIARLSKKLGDIPNLVMEVIAIGEALRITSERNMDKVLIESNSQLVINSIRGSITVPSQIINYGIYIINIVRNFDDIQFSYCNRSKIPLRRIAKRSHCACNDVCLY